MMDDANESISSIDIIDNNNQLNESKLPMLHIDEDMIQDEVSVITEFNDCMMRLNHYIESLTNIGMMYIINAGNITDPVALQNIKNIISSKITNLICEDMCI
jgi:hypothetical protein